MVAISPHAFSVWIDLRGGSPAWRMAESMLQMAPAEYSADLTSGTYLDPPLASSSAAMTRSDTTWKQRATADGTARTLVLASSTDAEALRSR